MRKMMRIGSVGLVVGVAVVGSGCMRDGNSRLTLGYEGEGNGIVLLQGVTEGPVLAEAVAPSVVGLDRSHWEDRVLLVPNDGVFTYPHLTRLEPLYDDSTARSRGEFPTALSALETDGDLGAQVWEAFAWPGWVLMDLVLAIPRATDGPVASPLEGYERRGRHAMAEAWEGPASPGAPMEIEAVDE